MENYLQLPERLCLKVPYNDKIIEDTINLTGEDIERFFSTEIDGGGSPSINSTSAFACQSESVPKEDAALLLLYKATYSTGRQNSVTDSFLSRYLSLNNEATDQAEVKKEENKHSCCLFEKGKNPPVESAENVTSADNEFQTCADDNIKSPVLVLTNSNKNYKYGATATASQQTNFQTQNGMQIDGDGDTPLHIFVARCNQADELRLKEQHYKRYVNVQNNQRQTPLHLAVEIGNVHIIQVLIEFGAYVNVFDDRLETPLHAALDLKSRNRSLLLVRAIVSVLLHASDLEFGCNLDSKNQKGLSAMHLAMLLKDFEIIKILCQHGCNINEKENKSGLTPLMLLIKLAKEESNMLPTMQLAESVIRQLPVDVNIRSYSGDSPLHLACACDYLPLVEVLVDKGAIVNEKNVYKKTEKDMTAIKEIKDYLEVHYRKKRRKRKITDN